MRIGHTTAAMLLALGVAPAASLAATAGDPGNGSGAVTLLHLSVVGTVHDTPDVLTAVLDGTTSSADPAAAQHQLDNKMKAATELAGGVKGVAWQVAGYAVDQTEPGPGRTAWSAHQTLELHAADADAAALLGLVGHLQGAGLTVQSLQWELSPARRVADEQRATAQALTLLRDRAEAAAATLGLKMDAIRSITLGETDHTRPVPMMRMMAVAAAPQATRFDADISQDANAEIALKR